jgi:hypothetical protein
MTLASKLMPNFTGAGKRKPPASARSRHVVLHQGASAQGSPGTFIFGWQLLKVFVQMLAHLIFGRCNEPQADLVADQPGDRTNPERHAIKQRIEHAGMAAQLMNALLAPDQVVDFFFGGMLHGGTHFRQLGGQGLTLVQRLGADFTGVVDAHQAGNVPSVFIAHLRIRLHDGRRRTVRLTTEGQQSTHCGIGLQQKAVNWRVVTLGSHADLRGISAASLTQSAVEGLRWVI